MLQIKRTLNKPSDAFRLFLISSASPLQLLDFRAEYDITSPILYDHKDAFSSMFKIFAYLLNMIVNGNLQIEEVIPTQLSEDNIRELLDDVAVKTAS
jgi:hypothetical protein